MTAGATVQAVGLGAQPRGGSLEGGGPEDTLNPLLNMVRAQGHWDPHLKDHATQPHPGHVGTCMNQV